MPTPRDAIVLGGGLAGIAAALRLTEHGIPVTLIETRKRLGGRATSFVDRETGRLIDNCQHVLLGCCTNLIDLYDRLGVADRIGWCDRLHFFDKQHHHDVLCRNPGPAPLHLSRALGRMNTLSRADKRAIRRGMFAMMRTGRRGRAAWAERSFADWLAAYKQPESAVKRFWEVIVISACNQTADRLSAGYAMQVFQEGFLAHRDAYIMGVSRVPLAALYDGAAAAIEANGGKVRLGTSVRALNFDGRRVAGVSIDNAEHLTAERVISALPFDRLSKISGAELTAFDDRLQPLDDIAVSPIIGIHLWFNRPVIERDHMIFVDSPLQWVFRKTDPAANGEGGEDKALFHLHGVISAAHQWVDQPADRIAEMAVRELKQYAGVNLKKARLVRHRVVKEKRATFSAAPGIDRMRPPTSGAVDNLLLAGDWTDTGWPATMEGATRSGYAAAGAALGENLIAPDLKPSLLYRLLSG